MLMHATINRRAHAQIANAVFDHSRFKGRIHGSRKTLGRSTSAKRTIVPQATLAALMNALHFRDDTLFRSCFGFHGGGGNSSDGACGALVGGTLAIGYVSAGCAQNSTCASATATRPESSSACTSTSKRNSAAPLLGVHRKTFGGEFNVWDEQDLARLSGDGRARRAVPQCRGSRQQLGRRFILGRAARRDEDCAGPDRVTARIRALSDSH